MVRHKPLYACCHQEIRDQEVIHFSDGTSPRMDVIHSLLKRLEVSLSQAEPTGGVPGWPQPKRIPDGNFEVSRLVVEPSLLSRGIHPFLQFREVSLSWAEPKGRGTRLDAAE